jgi:hypothetical protein
MCSRTTGCGCARRIDIARHWKPRAPVRRDHGLRLGVRTMATATEPGTDQHRLAGRVRRSCCDGTYEHSPWIADARLGRAPVRQHWTRSSRRSWPAGAREPPRRAARRSSAPTPSSPGKAMVARTLTAESHERAGQARA